MTVAKHTTQMRAVDDADGVYRCPMCLQGFWTKRGLTLHALSHQPTDPGDDRG